MSRLPWAQESLAVIDGFKVKREVIDAFLMVKESEKRALDKERKDLQFDALLAMANHEQLNILQPLIYEDPVFQTVLDVQRAAEGIPCVPLRSAAFSTACDVEDPELREQMVEGDLYSTQDRMRFIRKVAVKYHGLMVSKKEYMERTIAEISKWRHRE